ncbi:unnamed protein product [Nyctereutes procyonoides]|uniref:Large ribosomal subunit protein mL42 n=1 Tax=Nyctereutes procyonoides TaxID=34880 RepID=A0A811Z2H2_NYCPR|nr:unnamed protein product [Nyctereutes procyonoides]
MALAVVKWVIPNRTIWKHLFPTQNRALYCLLELALISDGRRTVGYHPSVEIPYEHTQLIPWSDLVHNNEETHDQHHWYHCGQYHRTLKKLDSPKDR